MSIFEEYGTFKIFLVDAILVIKRYYCLFGTDIYSFQDGYLQIKLYHRNTVRLEHPSSFHCAIIWSKICEDKFVCHWRPWSGLETNLSSYMNAIFEVLPQSAQIQTNTARKQ